MLQHIGYIAPFGLQRQGSATRVFVRVVLACTWNGVATKWQQFCQAGTPSFGVCCQCTLTAGSIPAVIPLNTYSASR